MSDSKRLEMLKEKIEETRQYLNDLIGLEEGIISNKKIMDVSQMLDDLLVEYLKEQDKKLKRTS
ncbi:MAG: aspartyl-phosphate phosphatase Spo0E family protein [Epulopiscium sp.]|nr:aspartyl-phosphate phosphatase Spo0E family protein [Candidatus Epulonipiscium sp.]